MTSSAPAPNPGGARTMRSADWFAGSGRNGFIHRSWMRNQGFPDDVMDGRPVIGIATTWSQLTPCNAHLNEVAESVARGVWEQGALPLIFPAMSLGEPLMRPTTMLYRNLLAMELEELIRANPLDGVVLLSGCDKTTPGMLMGAISVDLPTIMLTGGPMLNGIYRGERIGSGTAVWQLTERHRAGQLTDEDLTVAEACMSRSRGHCNTMGTASTMACLVEALGMQLSGSAALPAPDSRRYALSQAAGRRIVEVVAEDLRPSRILTRAAFENAIRVNAALGGSTNAIVHLLALAGRAEVPLSLEDFDRLGAQVPLLVDLMPSGRFLMEEFAYAGGLPALLRELLPLLSPEALTVDGVSLETAVAGAETHLTPNGQRVIADLTDPVQPAGSGTVVVRGTLAPEGAVLKVSAASPELLEHEGIAHVFDTAEDYTRVVNDPDFALDPTDVIVVRGGGPVGYPGFPEIGNVPLPAALLKAGVTDIVRISDARMSGTGYGTCILHVSPESAVGGPLALVRTGDRIALSVRRRRLDLLVDPDELAERARTLPQVQPLEPRGWVRLYRQHVGQAHEGADLDFLIGRSGAQPPRHSH
ncbi:IlvD/Edd family dehydratase [Pseudactinotalea sp. Z1748]|uniref:IlvD/Edd family dehydratase n=1 Tax=Pseudactinotalea sp. Z1748 TaxID=3413027 RepID=UPI003C7DA38D